MPTPPSALDSESGRNAATGPDVVRWRDALREAVAALLAGYGLELVDVAPGRSIPGSYWGDDEAGLIGERLYARPDTPLHSILHESCHFICMDARIRVQLRPIAACAIWMHG